MIGENAQLKIWLADQRTRAVRYRSDPIAEVFHLRDNVYSIYSKCPHNMGDVWTHVIIGPERAMVIDTGFGIGDLRGLVDELTNGMDVIAVNTHNHGDHILGNGQFEKVYCHEADEQMQRSKMYPGYWEEFCRVTDHSFFRDEDVIPFRPYEIVPCKDHTVFCLGDGYDVELIWTAGHASGNCVFLDKASRVLYSGDSVMADTPSTSVASRLKAYQDHPEFTTLHAFRDRWEGVVDRCQEFDTIFPGHSILDISPQYAIDLLDACNTAVQSRDSYDEAVVRNGVACKIKYSGLASVCFIDERW